MSRVTWEKVNPEIFEDMGAVLLSRLHPESQRIDGQGGDGGRDVELRVNGKVELFQLKFFLGRVSKEKGRRTQVERSLRRAAARNPDRWSLVVPIDPSPGELAWFDLLREQYVFPLEWKGRTWLESQLADHPSIVRHYLHDGYREVVEALTELQREEAVLEGGVADILSRLHALNRRIEEADPHYRLDFNVTAGTTTIAVIPRYPGAERDRPISIRAVFSFPTTPDGLEAAQRFRNVFEFGDGAEIMGDYIDQFKVDGLRGMDAASPALIKIGPAEVDRNVQIAGRLSVVDPQGGHLGSMALTFRERRRGSRGGTLTGSDVTGMITVSIRFDLSDRGATTNLAFSQPDESTPGMVLPVLRVLRHLKRPNRCLVTLEGHALGEPMSLPESDLVPELLYELIEGLDRIQAFSRTSFPTPDGFTRQDVAVIRRAVRLISGERVVIGDGPVTTSIIPHSTDTIRELLTEGSAHAFRFDIKAYTISIGETEVSLGPARTYVRGASVHLPTGGELSGGSMKVELHPIGDAKVELELLLDGGD